MFEVVTLLTLPSLHTPYCPKCHVSSRMFTNCHKPLHLGVLCMGLKLSLPKIISVIDTTQMGFLVQWHFCMHP